MGDTKFKEVELTRIELKENEILAVTIKSDDITEQSLQFLKVQLQGKFPANQVVVFGMGQNDDVKFAALGSQEGTETCKNCTCGKNG